jgi:hypothetical protein
MEKYFTKEDAELMIKFAKAQPPTLQGMANSIYFNALGNAILLSPNPKDEVSQKNKCNDLEKKQ